MHISENKIVPRFSKSGDFSLFLQKNDKICKYCVKFVKLLQQKQLTDQLFCDIMEFGKVVAA